MFWTRLLSGACLVALSILFIWFGGIPLAAILLALSIGAYVEMAKALKINKEGNALMVTGFVLISIFYVLLALDLGNIYLVMAAVFSIIIYLTVYVCAFPKYTVEDVMGGIFAYLYGPIMLSFIFLTRGLDDGFIIVWLIYICSWGYDTFAYCVGMLTGKTIGNHKCFPKLSPKKSYEGIVGGVLGAALLAFLYGRFVVESFEVEFVIIAAVGAIIAQVGDLAASAVKRNKDIKDYSKVIPGHGGILDRFDSMIFTAPIIYFLALLLINANY